MACLGYVEIYENAGIHDFSPPVLPGFSRPDIPVFSTGDEVSIIPDDSTGKKTVSPLLMIAAGLAAGVILS